ncbi:restriction endonuclease subunit S [Rhizobium sp.]|jgi:type I restriction enzyme, S subunit|uniref:restriction endonuclease subunit S n=1 Tax=Rhizobium sp. TaxID=391 RepID=UPI000E9987BE|nr:restriction endonuclease subunit S [Rhizobium sp.]
MSSKRKSSASLIPERRFPGFSGPWAHEPLSSVLTEHKVKNAAGHDVFSVSMESGIVNQIEHLGRSFAAADTSRYNVGHRSDVVYTKSPLKAFPFGIVKQCKFAGGVALSPLYGVFTPKNPHVGLMIEAFFETPERAQAFLSPLCQKGAKNTLQITNATFLSGKMALPKEEGEQQKIADLLYSADALIAAQGRKVEALKADKKGLMQRLFPQEGDTQPRLRFPEFEGEAEWVNAKLGDYVAIGSGGSPSNFMLSSAGKYPFVKVDDLNNCAKYQITGREFCNESSGAVPTNSIIFPKRGAAIELNKIRITAKEILMDTNLMAITPSRKIISEFLYYYLSNVGLSHLSDTSTIPQINNKHIIPFNFLLPNRSEQQRIADCLSSLDDLIAAETQKLSMLRTHKKGLLQQLFPQIGESDA